MKRKRTFFDIVAAGAFIFNVDWDEEYDLLPVEDIFWENIDTPIRGTITDVTFIEDTRMQVS